MTTHFAAIGVPLVAEDDLVEFIHKVSDQSEMYEVANGRYLRWSSSTGAQVWIQVDPDWNLVGCNPHFAGETRLTVGLMHRIDRFDQSPLDGSYDAWAGPRENDQLAGEYPFVFDSPDYLLHQKAPLPRIADVQLAAFAHRIAVFDSDEAFTGSQTSGIKLASESFIPSGLFAKDAEKLATPEARALISGHVIVHKRLMNEVTGHFFHALEVDTLGGRLDVVVDPELAGDWDPAVGSVISGEFWISGRILWS
jgi:hypothetical protein